MEDNISNLIIILVILVLMSAFFSASETSFSALNKIRLKNLANNGNKKASLALHLSKKYDTLLSTILIGNNIVNIAMASIGTVVFTHYFGSKGVAYSTIFITVVILIVGEISPKSLAKEAPEKVAMMSAPILQVLIKVLAPFNWFFTKWKLVLSKMFKVHEDRGITEEELITIIDEAQHEGGLNEDEGELIRSAVEFNELEVTDVLTPRVNVVGVSIEASNEEIMNAFYETGYSRLPVYNENIDNVVGVLHEKQFHAYLYQKKGESLIDIVQPAIWTTESTKISKLLKLLQSSKSHIAFITDEYGGMTGIVTMEDIIEELVGEIWDEHDEIVQEIQEISKDEYLISGLVSVYKMFDLFGKDSDHDFNTVGGFAFDQLGRIPVEGDRFEYDDLEITITKTDFRKILQVHVVKKNN